MGFISGILYVVVLILNAMCVLSEDRFLARINLSPKSIDPTFGQPGADASVWSKIASLISSVRMVVRCTFCALRLAPTPPSPQPGGPKADHQTPTVPLIFVNTVIIVYELILG
ncbi:hypothetical protein KVR01_004996 [Diaporthe batatas]|uniref:uncharacterized protein n=1 Tax=Diaporthe batatas TaxID=748121 RepID=UPI001D055EF5|nr:uncharacterized protein KVR01_004996 [Diaporthe batatas]KAG8164721.1 hypothetical protein KVR01_004996 [Diaporthe batatas]